MVELHNGTVEAFSDGRGRGSTFVIKLPLTQLRPTHANLAHATAALSYTADHSSHPSAARIVLVEDIDDNREVLQAILELEGYEVIAAADGEAGCEAIVKHKPSLALIDIGLPGMDGYEVARRVRHHPGCENIRLIALTGYGRPDDVATAISAGFDAHLVKPVDPDRLTSMIEDIQHIQQVSTVSASQRL